MKWLSIICLFVSAFIFAGDDLEIELNSGNTISIDAYKADGETLFLYLPSERGFGKGHIPTVQQLAFEGYDIWVADLHSSYMVPKYRSSINRFDVTDLLDLIAIAEKQSFKNIFFLTSGRGAQLALKIAYQWQSKYPNSNLLKGHIFHSPHLIDGRPDLGGVAKYVNIAKHSNLPIYMLLPQFGTKFLRGKEIYEHLEQGGSPVFMHRLANVHGGFHMRNTKDLTKFDIKIKENLADIYHQALQLMKTVRIPKVLSSNQDLNTNAKVTFSEPMLQKYHGEQNLPLSLKTLTGEVVNINDYKNQVLLLNFWASWCKPCVTEIPSLIRLQQKLSTQNFKIITINVAEPKNNIVEFVKKVKLNLPVLLDDDGQTVKNWGVYAYPSNFLIDKNGVIRYGYRGALEWDEQSIIDTIRTLL